MESQEAVIEQEKVVETASRLISKVKRRTRRKYTSEDKIKIVLEGFRGELPVSDCHLMVLICVSDGGAPATPFKTH